MPKVKNTTEEDIEQMYDGKVYTFPAGQCVTISDPDVARWFYSKRYQPPNPQRGRDKPYEPLIVINDPPEPPKPPRVVKPAPPLPPPLPPKPAEPDPEIKRRVLSERWATAPTGLLIAAAKKAGIYRKTAARLELANKLAELGVELAV